MRAVSAHSAQLWNSDTQTQSAKLISILTDTVILCPVGTEPPASTSIQEKMGSNTLELQEEDPGPFPKLVGEVRTYLTSCGQNVSSGEDLVKGFLLAFVDYRFRKRSQDHTTCF